MNMPFAQIPTMSPQQLAAGLAGMDEATEQSKPHCPPESYAIGVVTGFSITQRYKAGLQALIEYTVESSGQPAVFPAGLEASETINGLDDHRKDYKARQQVRLKSFMAACYGMKPSDPQQWINLAVFCATNPRTTENAHLHVIGKRFMVVTEAQKYRKDQTGKDVPYTPKSFQAPPTAGGAQ